MHALRLSTPKIEGVLQASKWLKVQVLLDVEEMQELFSTLGDFFIFVGSEVVQEGAISRQEFLKIYAGYVSALKEGTISTDRMQRRTFSSLFTRSQDALYAQEVGENRFLIKPILPIVQLQAHHFFVSRVDGNVYPMVLSSESITWGLQFSYPSLVQDLKTYQIAKVNSTYMNSSLFTHLMQWMRKFTAPTPLFFQNKKINVPIRLGKKCFSWISSHPQLLKQGVQVWN